MGGMVAPQGIASGASLSVPSTGTAKVRLESGESVITGHKPGAPDQVGQDLTLVQPIGDSGLLFLGVFDGHGKNGYQVAAKTREIFKQNASRFALPPGQLRGALQQLFLRAQKDAEQDEGASSSGTTVTVAVVDPASETVTIAHVGDSAAIIGQGTNCVFETKDHDFDDSDVQRVEAAGGEIKEFPTQMKTVRRIYAKGQNYPALALSRSIGDVDAHKWGVLAEPTVSEAIPFKMGNLLVLASDGVWNVVSKDSVLNIATVGSAAEATDRVVQCAKESWPSTGTDYVDDISAIIVKAMPIPQPEAAPNFGAPAPSPSQPAGGDQLGFTRTQRNMSALSTMPIATATSAASAQPVATGAIADGLSGSRRFFAPAPGAFSASPASQGTRSQGFMGSASPNAFPGVVPVATSPLTTALQPLTPGQGPFGMRPYG